MHVPDVQALALAKAAPSESYNHLVTENPNSASFPRCLTFPLASYIFYIIYIAVKTDYLNWHNVCHDTDYEKTALNLARLF